MNIFVTGATGFIGGYFVREAVQRGHTIYALRRKGSTPKIALDDSKLEWVERPLLDDYFKKCEVLVHFAAQGVSPQSVTWEDAFLGNVQNSLSLWLKAFEVGVKRMIVCGSLAEYGESARQYEFIPPSAPLEPMGPYASSKAASSLAALALGRSQGMNVCVIRPSNVYGEGQDERNFWPSLKRAALAGEDFLMTPGEQVRDFVSVEYVAEYFLDFLETPQAKDHQKVLHVGSGQPKTLLDFANEWWLRWKASGRILKGALPYREREYMRLVPLL